MDDRIDPDTLRDGYDGTDLDPDRCILCNRRLGARPSMVNLDTAGMIVPADTFTDDDDPDDLGWWGIGAECRRRVPETHRTDPS